jgi:tetratricopeptide (TPR) repeat protein
MVQMAFFLRFKHQLQRTRPELVPHLEEMTVQAVKEAGGKMKRNRSLVHAQFDENTLGFWIDILLLIETLVQTMETAAADLYGYSIVLGLDVPESPESLCRFLAGRVESASKEGLPSREGGVFLDRAAAMALQPYIAIEESGDWTLHNKYGAGAFVRLKEIRIFIPKAKAGPLLWESSTKITNLEQQPAILVTNQSFEGKRDKLYLRVAGYANTGNEGDFPSLFIRFGFGGLNAITDCICQTVGIQINGLQNYNLKALWMESEAMAGSREFLFRQRLNDTPSSYAIRTAGHYFDSLLTMYSKLAGSEEKTPVVILENIHSAERAAADIVIESLGKRKNFLLVGTCAGQLNDTATEKWGALFPQLLEAGTEELSYQGLPNLSPELWEIGYACLLLGRYFPPDLFPKLFEEMGKSPMVFSRAISLLYAFGVIDTQLDPRPWHWDFQRHAEAALGERKERIRALVRSRLLAWVAQRKIDPCLRLLVILQQIGGNGDIHDSLILRAIRHELTGGHTAKLEGLCNRPGLGRSGVLSGGTLGTLTGPYRAPVLRYITETSLALNSGSAQNIRNVFINPLPECPTSPLLKAQALLNQSLFFLGQRDGESAVEATKEAVLLCQKGGGAQAAGGCLSQAYRLFALASLLRRRIGETIDYLGFSLENAAKSGDSQDIGIAAYYAASVQLLYGNLSRSRILTEKARRHFLKAGNPEWADRSRFLEGRLAFEIGSYQQAIDCFDDIRENPEGDNSTEKTNLLEAWACRARVCRRGGFAQTFNSELVGGGYDANLFELEALCLAGDYPKAAEYSVGPPSGEEFFCIERPDWRSGFAQCELLYFSWNDLRDRMLCAYHALAGSEEAARIMQRILRSGQFPEIDPCDAFYHYTWYRVLEQTNADQVDISTAVSVAFKRLQGRAARIDDVEIRRQYLTQPYWNKALEKAARDFKLV